ncbi:MAG: hypothetical protein EBZ62_05465 [Sphingobacteriia bacterium]|nr:hypothetical protein [Sphingobacteriia bacterium]
MVIRWVPTPAISGSKEPVLGFTPGPEKVRPVMSALDGHVEIEKAGLHWAMVSGLVIAEEIVLVKIAPLPTAGLNEKVPAYPS